MQEDAQRKTGGHKVQDRFMARDIFEPGEAISRILCSINGMDQHDTASAYFIICGQRLRYIGHEVWETLPDTTRPFPPDTPGEFLSSFNDDSAGEAGKRYTHHEVFCHIIDGLKAMDLDTLARAYHVFFGEQITVCHSDGDRCLFIIESDEQAGPQ